ncbi:IS1-like element transposase [Salmonella enterica]
MIQIFKEQTQPGTHQKIIDMAMNGVGCLSLNDGCF